MSIAHVSKYPENDNAGLEPVHSSLGETDGWIGWREEGKTEGVARLKQREGGKGTN